MKNVSINGVTLRTDSFYRLFPGRLIYAYRHVFKLKTLPLALGICPAIFLLFLTGSWSRAKGLDWPGQEAQEETGDVNDFRLPRPLAAAPGVLLLSFRKLSAARICCPTLLPIESYV